MFKHLIILSLTFLLISCGEEETTTKEETTEETTTVANTQTATTNSDTSQTESAVIDEDITEALFGNPDMFEETDLPEEPTPAIQPKTESTPPTVTPTAPVVAQQETPNTEEGDIKGHSREQFREMERQRKSQLTEENSFLVYNGYPGDFSVESDWAVFLSVIFFKGESFQILQKGTCLRVHNRHLGSIRVRRGSDLNPLIHVGLMGTICKKSECPTGDIFIGYTEDDDGEKVPAVRNLMDDDRDIVDCSSYKVIL